MNGCHRVVLKGLHGKVAFELQRLVERATGTRCTYFEVTGQFEDSYMSPQLQEWVAYYSNRMSYAEVEGLVERVSGERLLSDQRIEQLVIAKAVEVSEGWVAALPADAAGLAVAAPTAAPENLVVAALPAAPEDLAIAALPADAAGLAVAALPADAAGLAVAAPTAAPAGLVVGVPRPNPEVDLYSPTSPEVRLFEDGIGVKGQKATRPREPSLAPDDAPSAPRHRVITDVAMLEQRDGGYEYLCEGIDPQGQTVITLEAVVQQALRREYGDHEGPLDLVVISDGANTIRNSLQAIFGTAPVVILDWYHLRKKCRELMSMIAFNKADKERHLQVILNALWTGNVAKAIDHLNTEVAVRNADKHQELIGYLDKHRHEIIDYGRRQQAGKPVGSGRMEKGVDQVIGQRQKKKAMSWSAKGSKALAILKVVELNGRWQQLWFPDEEPEYALAA